MRELNLFAKNANFLTIAGVRKIVVFNVSIVKNATYLRIFQVKSLLQEILYKINLLTNSTV